MPCEPSKRGKSAPTLEQITALFLWTSLTTLLCIALAAWVGWQFGHALPGADQLLADYSVNLEDFLADQPRKNAAFCSLCVTLPLSILLFAYSHHLWIFRLSRKALQWSIIGLIAVISLSTLYIFFLSFFQLYFPGQAVNRPMGSNWIALTWLFESMGSLEIYRWGFISLVIVFYIFVQCFIRSQRKRINVMFLAFIIYLLLLSPSHFYFPTDITNDWIYTHHLNPIINALSKVRSHLNVLEDFPHRYGLYCELLAPVIWALPHPFLGCLWLPSFINTIALLTLLTVHRLTIRSSHAFFISFWATITLLVILPADDHYFPSTIRRFFPCMIALLIIVYLKKPSLIKFVILSLCCGLSTIWNADTGFACCASTLAVIALRQWRLFGFDRTFFLIIGSFIGALVAVWGVFLGCIVEISGSSTIHLDWINYFQKLYVELGYYCLEPSLPDFWILYIIFYAMCITYALVFYIYGNRKFPGWRIDLILFLGILNLALLTYNLARTCEANLLSATFLFPLTFGLVLSESKPLIARIAISFNLFGDMKTIKPMTLCFTLMHFIMIYWAGVGIATTPQVVLHEVNRLVYWNSNPQTPFLDHCAYLRSVVQPGEPIIILSDLSGPYFLDTEARDVLKESSSDEWLYMKDIRSIESALQSHSSKYLVLDNNIFTYHIYRKPVLDKIRNTVTTNYIPISHSSDGEITLYQARE